MKWEYVQRCNYFDRKERCTLNATKEGSCKFEESSQRLLREIWHGKYIQKYTRNIRHDVETVKRLI